MASRRRLQLAAIIVLVIAYACLSHYGNSAMNSHHLGLVLGLGPVLAVALLLLWRSIGPWAALPAAAAALLLRHYWPVLERNFSVVYLLQEIGLYGLMAATFGRSLLGDRVALCTQLADRIHGPLSAEEVRYTRRITAAWALFFLIITVATVGFFALAPLRVWSLFANFCVIPLVAVMFVAEYALRHHVLPHVPRRGILAAVKVYFANSP
jgi:uncharacterized membrane protein